MSTEKSSPRSTEQNRPDLDQPLGLTVHELPRAERVAPVNRNGRLKMLFILLVCAAPVIASYFMYYVVRPEGRRNYGELITPQRPLPTFNVTTANGAEVPVNSLKDQWLLISVAGGACDAVCQQHLYFQRQLRESLGREKDRLDWVWLVTDNAPIPAALEPALKGATVLRVSPADVSQWLEAGPGHRLADHLYLVDPLGNWMMRFPAAMDAVGAGKAKLDLERLLRASSSWDNEGRP
ncbi:MAG: hypothetical protein Q7U05_02725 [Polaromonas sp.]|nr:hypothetical protein [Polaromonas sp.]